jgi:S1-C subfamily serine protease
MLFQEPIKEEKINKDSSISKKIIISLVIASLLLGVLGGGLSSYLLLLNLDKFGLALKDGNSLKVQNVETEKVSLQEEESATIKVVKNAQPSVVSIIISKELPTNNQGISSPFGDIFNFGWPFDNSFQQPVLPQDNRPQAKQEIGGGTGFIVSEDGLILTNKHVVFDDKADYSVLTNDGQKYDAKVLAKDPINDLAVIKIEAKDLTSLPLGDSDNIQIGQTVIAIGNTLSEYRNTVTKGLVSGINRRVEAGSNMGYSEVLEEAIQTDAAINPGNSGGPLLNLQGQVIGINTAVSQAGQSIGFAIPINEAKQVIESIQKYGKIVRPYLGVRYLIINKQIAQANDLKVDYGALIKANSAQELAVVPGSPADKAGLVENDIILEVNGQKIDDSHSLARILSKSAPGDEVELKIWHKGEEKTVKVKLTERPVE